MDAGNIILLVAIVLIVALIAYVVWRNQKVRTSVGLGPIKMNLDTERTTEHATQHTSQKVPATLSAASSAPTAQLSVGNIQGSSVTNEGAGGGAQMKAGDIAHSHIVNTAGAAQRTRAARAAKGTQGERPEAE